MPDTKLLAPSQISVAGLQVRVETNRAHVDDLVELFDEDNPVWPDLMPPVVVFFDGTAYHCADGHHRLAGAQEAGCTAVPCEVHAGDQTAALWFACQANGSHGLRRTSEDKRNAVRVAYRLDPSLSDNAIARRCRVSPDLANYTLRPLRSNAPLSESDSGGDTASVVNVVVGQDAPLSDSDSGHADQVADSPTSRAPDIRVDARGRRMNVSNIGKGRTTTNDKPATVGTGAAPRGVDELGVPIPNESVAEAFAVLDFFADIDSDLIRVAKKIDQLSKMPGTDLLRSNYLRLTRETRNGEPSERFHSSDLTNLRRELGHWKPHAACPYCRERINPGCGACKGLGWVTQTAWDRCPERVREQALAMTAQASPEPAAG